jgi:hypothetical protein
MLLRNRRFHSDYRGHAQYKLRSMRSPSTKRWFRGNLLVWLQDQTIRSYVLVVTINSTSFLINIKVYNGIISCCLNRGPGEEFHQVLPTVNRACQNGNYIFNF